MLENSLYNMDGIEGLRRLAPGTVDMLLCDLPYGTTRNDWDVQISLSDFWAAAKKAVKPNGAILLFGQCPYDKVIGVSNLKMLRYEWIWYKDKGTGFLNARRAPLKKTEHILVFYRKNPVYHPQWDYRTPYAKKHVHDGASSNYNAFRRKEKISISDGRRYPGNVIRIPGVARGIHPTQKPVALFEYLIRTYTDEQDLVVDICAGSGTTAVACMRMNRRYICCEINKGIYELARERLGEEERRKK